MQNIISNFRKNSCKKSFQEHFDASELLRVFCRLVYSSKIRMKIPSVLSAPQVVTYMRSSSFSYSKYHQVTNIPGG